MTYPLNAAISQGANLHDPVPPKEEPVHARVSWRFLRTAPLNCHDLFHNLQISATPRGALAMRGFAAISASILFAIAAAPRALADAAPDLSAAACAWKNLSTAEQTRLNEEFKVELLEGSFKIFFGAPNAQSVAEAARQCQLNLAAPQLEHLGLAVARHAGVEKAKGGIAAKGEKPESIQITLGKVHEGKRVRIGDRLGCPGPHAMVAEWDESMKAAIRRANLRFNDGRAYSWVSLGVYASMAEEGAVRRMNGQAEPCS